ncbi:MAG TPA: response regulator [Candidatus Micrarchaeaceae archaeon]|nr:response regulator [Candidatus Micrarchaeaceae archaeon]
MSNTVADRTVIRVVVVDDIASTRENLKKLLSFEDDIEVVGTAGDGRTGIDLTRQLSPHVVLMDVNMPGMDGITATETLAVESPNSPVVIMSVQGERDYLRRAMQSGAREFLIKPFTGDELVSSIRRVYELEEKKGSYLPRQPPSAGESGGQPPPGCQLALVLSGKGGCGKTFLAINLAAALRLETGRRVCLVDLDLQFGDVGVMLNLDHAKTITELVESESALDWEFVDDILADGPEGIRVLLGPFSPEFGDLVRAEHVRSIVDVLRREFDYVVVDCGSQLSEATLEAIELADHVIVVGELTIPAIKDTRLMLRMLESLKVDRARVMVAINAHDAHAVYDAASIERNLRFPVKVQIPSEPRLVGGSIHRAVPLVVSHPESDVSLLLRSLARSLAPAGAIQSELKPETKPTTSRRFGRRR